MNKNMVMIAFGRHNQNSAFRPYLISNTKMRERLGNSKRGWVVT